MADLTSAPPARASDPLVYRPVSLMAVLGFGISVVTAFLIVSIGAIAFWSGMPLLMPYILLPAFLGFAFSLAGRWAIARSEGTRAGLFLANCGIGISLLFGLGYGTYVLIKELAVRIEAQTEADRWFENIQKGDKYAAFLRTVAPETRKSDRPDDKVGIENRYLYGGGSEGERGPLLAYLDLEYLRAMEQAGPDLKYECQGVNRWEYKGGANKVYEVQQTYRITTPEVQFDLLVVMLGMESQSKLFPGRQWQIVMQGTTVAPDEQGANQLFSLGKAIRQLRMDLARFVMEWKRKLGRGQLLEAYLDTCDPAERDKIRNEYAARQCAAWMAAGATPGVSGCFSPFLYGEVAWRPTFGQGFQDFLDGSLIEDGDTMITFSNDVRKELTTEMKRYLRDISSQTRLVPELTDPRTAGYSRWSLEDNTFVRFDQPFEYVHFQRKYRCEGTFEIVARNPTLVLALAALKGAPAGTVPPTANQSWQIRRIKLNAVTGLPQGPPGGG